MRIALNAQKLTFVQQYHAGGISRYIYHLLAELPSAGPAHSYRAFVPSLPPDPRLTGARRLSFVPSPFPTEHPLARVLWEQVVLPAQLVRGTDLHHGLAYALPLAWRGRSVVTVFDLSFLRHPELFNRGNRAYLATFTRLAVKRAGRVLTISEHARRETIELLGARPDRVVTTYCAADERFRPLPADEVRAFRAAKGLPERFVLYLGTLEPRKNVVTLLEAYGRLRATWSSVPPLILAGGRGWMFEPVFEAIERLGLREHVSLPGYVPAEEQPLWYNAAAVFVYPSLYEGFGLPPLEAMACGTPVVTSNAASLPEVVGDAGLLVGPLDAGGLAAALRRVLEDERLQAQLRQAGREQAAGFSWGRMAHQTVEAYEQLLSTP